MSSKLEGQNWRENSADLCKPGPAQFSKAQFSDNLHSLNSARIVAEKECADMRSQSSWQNRDLADYHKPAHLQTSDDLTGATCTKQAA